MAGPVHYEVFVRKTAPAPWSLQMATEDRAHAIQTAEDMLADDRAAAVRVTKETLDPDTMEFTSLTVLTRGAPETQRKRVVPEDQAGPRCGAPQDFYTPHARETIGRVLEDWLARNGVTAFELLHRPDLAEKLDASGVEMQHAIQKIAVPESQDVGQPVHDLVRHYQKLSDQAVERVIAAGRRNLFPSLEDCSIADLAHRMAGQPERAFIMGGVVSGALKGLRGGRTRLDRLMDLADRAPMDGAPHAMVMVPIEQILCEMLAARTSLADILGPSLDQGASLAAVVRMVAPREINALIAQDPRLALQVPAVDGPAARLGARLEAGQFPLLSAALARMVLRELMSPRRLRPNDAAGEINILRTLATKSAVTMALERSLKAVCTSSRVSSRPAVTVRAVARVRRMSISPVASDGRRRRGLFSSRNTIRARKALSRGSSPLAMRRASRPAGPSTAGTISPSRASAAISMPISRGAIMRTTAARLPPWSWCRSNSWRSRSWRPAPAWPRSWARRWTRAAAWRLWSA